MTDNDPVAHPAHYTRGKVELIDVIEDLPFVPASIIKYVYRAGFKDPTKTVEDLQKAAFLINRLIQQAQAGEKKS